MEAFMDRWLLDREEPELRERLQDIPRERVWPRSGSSGNDLGNIAYLEAGRR